MCQDSNTVQLHTKRYPDSPSTTEEMLNWEYHLLFITVDQKLKYPIWVRLWRTGTLIYCWWECKMKKIGNRTVSIYPSLSNPTEDILPQI